MTKRPSGLSLGRSLACLTGFSPRLPSQLTCAWPLPWAARSSRLVARRIATHGVGVERTFMAHSPRVEKVEVAGHTHVRRAQLYCLRGRHGKAARLREKRTVTPEQAPEAAETPATG